jgi:hypothetical protein
VRDVGTHVLSRSLRLDAYTHDVALSLQFEHCGCWPLHLIFRDLQLKHARLTRFCRFTGGLRGGSLRCLCSLGIGNFDDPEVETEAGKFG